MPLYGDFCIFPSKHLQFPRFGDFFPTCTAKQKRNVSLATANNATGIHACKQSISKLWTLLSLQPIESWGMATSTMGKCTLLYSEGDTPSRAAVRQANICKPPHEQHFFPSLPMSSSSKVSGVDVWSLSCYGQGRQIASYLCNKTPQRKRCSRKIYI
jgi:hypothetical protein